MEHEIEDVFVAAAPRPPPHKSLNTKPDRHDGEYTEHGFDEV